MAYPLLALGFVLTLSNSCEKDGTENPSGETGLVTDADGNSYTSVTIGAQVWMVENLQTTKYNDGTAIPLVETWNYPIKPGYCWYNKDIANKGSYGALYNWYAVNTGKLAPTGWHVPTDADWTTLENYLMANGFNYDGITVVINTQNQWLQRLIGLRQCIQEFRVAWITQHAETKVASMPFLPERATLLELSTIWGIPPIGGVLPKLLHRKRPSDRSFIMRSMLKVEVTITVLVFLCVVLKISLFPFLRINFIPKRNRRFLAAFGEELQLLSILF